MSKIKKLEKDEKTSTAPHDPRVRGYNGADIGEITVDQSSGFPRILDEPNPTDQKFPAVCTHCLSPDAAYLGISIRGGYYTYCSRCQCRVMYGRRDRVLVEGWQRLLADPAVRDKLSKLVLSQCPSPALQSAIKPNEAKVHKRQVVVGYQSKKK